MSDAIERHPKGILDTSTVIFLNRLPGMQVLPQVPLITAVTMAELGAGPLAAKTDIERARRQAHLQQAEADFAPLPFDAEAARAFGGVAASLREKGRKAAARTYDAMIAAVAVAHGLPIYTCNPRDFEGIEGLEVVPVSIPS